MIERYKNKKWMQGKYTKEELSTAQIAKLCNKSQNTIWKWLKKFNVETRSCREGTFLANANHCNLTLRAIEWLNGELLGDGGLSSRSDYSARYIHTSKYLKYCEYVSNTLKSFGIEQGGKINKYYHKNMNCYTYRYDSHDYAELLPVYKEWYLKRKKIVPRDIKLKPLTVRQWYIGDGSLVKQKRVKPFIQLHTCGFAVTDVKWLIKQLTNLGFKTTRYSKSNTIHISTYSTKYFLDYIGKSPVKCYDYKFNYYNKNEPE